MKSYKVLLTAFAALALASCAQKASIDCTVAGSPDTQVIVKQLKLNSYDILDTVKTNASGHFRYTVKVAKGQPEFIYLFHGDRSIAALLLESGEKAVVATDTLGAYTVSGSEGSEKLQEVDRRYSDFIYKMAEYVNLTDDPSLPAGTRSAIQEEMTKLYVSHYRECVKYVVGNPYSLTVIPVLFEQLSEASPVFSQYTDAILFKNAYDSLCTVYPESGYVKSLGREADRRYRGMSIQSKIDQAGSVNFLDINIPDINGEKRSLASLDAKVILLHFWSSSDPEQKMFNLDFLKPLYSQYHSKGFEIYSVCIDADKARWAASVKSQGLEWINVNDGLGTASSIPLLYNITDLPSSFLIMDGNISTEQISGVDALKRVLSRELK